MNMNYNYMEQHWMNLRTIMLSEKVSSKDTYHKQHRILSGDTNICTKSKERQGNDKSQVQDSELEGRRIECRGAHGESSKVIVQFFILNTLVGP